MQNASICRTYFLGSLITRFILILIVHQFLELIFLMILNNTIYFNSYCSSVFRTYFLMILNHTIYFNSYCSSVFRTYFFMILNNTIYFNSYFSSVFRTYFFMILNTIYLNSYISIITYSGSMSTNELDCGCTYVCVAFRKRWGAQEWTLFMRVTSRPMSRLSNMFPFTILAATVRPVFFCSHFQTVLNRPLQAKKQHEG